MAVGYCRNSFRHLLNVTDVKVKERRAVKEEQKGQAGDEKERKRKECSKIESGKDEICLPDSKVSGVSAIKERICWEIQTFIRKKFLNFDFGSLFVQNDAIRG